MPDIIFSGIGNAFGIEGSAIFFATRFKYYKRVLNISNVFETFKTRLKLLKTRLEYYKRVLNILTTF